MKIPDWSTDLGRKPKLLIVDDQRINIRALYELFRQECDVLMATSGEQAIALSKSELPDLILLDVMMDDIDGYEVCRRLKADALTQNLPIIFLTGKDTRNDEVLGFELGAVDFISKPFHPVVVKARVQTHLAMQLQANLLRSHALIDGLTGVPNRRKFDEYSETVWRNGQREQTPLSLLMFDVDFFKRYNDRYGHQAGDVCLKSVARYLAQAPGRPYDLLARYGGEEFACLLPNTAAEGAVLIAEKMLAGIRELQIEHLDSIDNIVTVSIGVATKIPSPDSTINDLIAAADKQLYTAKAAGRAQYSAIELL